MAAAERRGWLWQIGSEIWQLCPSFEKFAFA
jgi:hypothetical protein